MANFQKMFSEKAEYQEETKHMIVPPTGRWLWNDDSQTVEFISSTPADECVLRKTRQTNVDFNDLQQRSDWLAEICTLTNRGRQSARKSLSPAQLNAYRSSVMQRQGDQVTMDDVKQVAVSLLQENYSLPIPFCFMALLESKELDDVLTALLLYLSCYFEHKTLENKSKPLMVVETITEQRMMVETRAKKEIAQKKLAICYFSLIMDLDEAQHTKHHKKHYQTAYKKGQMTTNSTEWLLHACLYSFFCFVAWVTFGRKYMRDIQEEVGRLLYSDSINTAVRRRTDGDSGRTPVSDRDCVTTGVADHEKTACNSTFKQRVFQRRPALSSIVNQCSPLMVSLLPSPEEQSPHLFLRSRERRLSPVQLHRCDSRALTEEINQQLASGSFGILGKPLEQFSRSTLIACEEQKDHSDADREPKNQTDDNNEDPGILVKSSKSSFIRPTSSDVVKYGSNTYTSVRNSAATIEAVTSDTD